MISEYGSTRTPSLEPRFSSLHASGVNLSSSTNNLEDEDEKEDEDEDEKDEVEEEDDEEEDGGMGDEERKKELSRTHLLSWRVTMA